MTNTQPKVVGIGNAVVDIIAEVDEAFLSNHDVPKGVMNLVDQDRSRELSGAISNPTMASGGSVANSMAGIASFGGSAGFIGRVRDDEPGKFYGADMEREGVYTPIAPAQDGGDTSRSIILVTPDAQRSMNTYLGASTELNKDDINHALIQEAEYLFLEGYLWDSERPREAMMEAADVALTAGTVVAFSMSDPFLADRYRDDIRNFLPHSVDLLFANEAEITSLYKVNTLAEALDLARNDVDTAVITRSEAGCVAMHKGETVRMPAVPVANVVDTTGAGDQFAAGYLFGLSTGRSMADCAQLGVIAAGEVISHIGPRPAQPLKNLIPG
ncbi:MAG: adenosine kinase [Alphaproteobacteria bacterium]|nr:adenosine kinase [Alphaproteobacteria bacterium SS10]